MYILDNRWVGLLMIIFKRLRWRYFDYHRTKKSENQNFPENDTRKCHTRPIHVFMLQLNPSTLRVLDIFDSDKFNFRHDYSNYGHL
jgi:hypothetical protein